MAAKPTRRLFTSEFKLQVLREANQCDRLSNSEPYADLAPAQAYSQLPDAAVYLCSIRTMYRILDDNRQVRERRNVPL